MVPPCPCRSGMVIYHVYTRGHITSNHFGSVPKILQGANYFRSFILMCNNSTSAGTSMEGTPMFAHVTFHRTFNPWGVSAPGGKMRMQLLKDHNFLNNSPIFIIENYTFNIFAFQKALHTVYLNLKNCFGFGERYLAPSFYGRAPAVSKHMQPLKWD